MVAVDFSVYSVQIVKYARGIAEDLKAKLVFVNVINKRDINAIQQAFAYHSENLSVDDCISKLKRERAEKMFRRCPVPLLSLRERDHQTGGAILFRPLYLFGNNYPKNTAES